MTEPTISTPGPAVPRTLGRYTLGRRLGEGGMGVVYHGTRDDGRQVAIKVLRPHIAHDPESRRRLEREVATLSLVHSPRVAAVLDADVDGPSPYLVTEYIPGVPLDTIVSEHGPLAGQVLVRLGRGLLEALESIHGVGIVHRDLKPGNVLMVGRDPVVIDFGIAQVANDVRLTMTGMVMGTPGYLSPEVVEGGTVTQATDQWGWAATLAYAASGHPPFGRGPMPVVLDRVIRGRTQLDGVDPQLRPLLAAALDPEPRRRPSSSQVMRALELYAAHRPVTDALRIQPPAPASSPGRTDPGGAARTPPAPWAAVGAAQPGPATTRHAPVEATRAQPVADTPLTRVQPLPGRPDAGPQQGWVQGPPPGWAEPQAGVPPPLVRDPYAPAEPAGLAGQHPPSDPRIGRDPRSGSVAACLLAFVGLAAVLPLLAWAVFAVWSVTARTTDHAVTALVLRRHEMGRRRSDVPMAVAASPWHLVRGVLAAGLALLLPLAFAVAASVITAGVLTQTAVLDADLDHPVPLAVGTALGALIAWWGPGGVSLRRGSRAAVRWGLPSHAVTQVVVGVLVAGGVGLLLWAVALGGVASWWPLGPETPFAQWVPSILQP